jgi:hypothetical protein
MGRQTGTAGYSATQKGCEIMVSAAEYELKKIVQILDKRLENISDSLKGIENELRIVNIALSREATKKGDGQNGSTKEDSGSD